MNLGRMELRVEPRREWRQQYVDAWRILRDWFYDPGMHGNDWNATVRLRERVRAEILKHCGEPDLAA
jgi:tricorn protease